MKIGVDMGHTLIGADYGAVGIKAESDLTREVGKKVIEGFKLLGHTVVNCTCDHASDLNSSLYYRVTKANTNKVDLYISIHFNKFNKLAHGAEIWTYNGERHKEAESVLNNIINLGYTNRGIKDGKGLYVLKNTSMKAMLIECCFCDNENDMNKFNAEKFANAIINGVTGQVPKIEPPKTQTIGVDKMKNLVLYHNDADIFGAVMLSQKYQCPLMKKSDYLQDKFKVKKIFEVGGKAGSNRFTTLKEVSKLL